MTDKENIYERFERVADEIEADPKAFNQSIYDDVIARKGQEWFDAHKAEVDAEIEGATALMGL